MGRGLAGRLAGGGHAVRAWNRSAPSPDVIPEGVVMVPELSDLADSEVLISMLAHDAAVRAVFLTEGLLEGLTPGAIHINMATVSVACARELHSRHEARGVAYIACPVLGRPDAAAEGRLHLLLAGPAAAIARLEALWGRLGQRAWRFGERPESANAVKIATNLALACAIEVMGEASGLAGAYGVDAGPYLDMLTQTLFSSPAFKLYGALIAEDRFEPPGFRLALGLKDVNLALEAGAEAAMPLPLGGLLRDRFLDCVAHGEAESDWCALVMAGRRQAGRA